MSPTNALGGEKVIKLKSATMPIAEEKLESFIWDPPRVGLSILNVKLGAFVKSKQTFARN